MRPRRGYRESGASLLTRRGNRLPLSNVRCLGGCGTPMAAAIVELGYRFHPCCAPDDHNPEQKV